MGVEGSTPRARQGEQTQSLGELSYILNTVVVRASEKLAMRVGLMQSSVSHMHISMQTPGQSIQAEATTQYMFLETDMCPVYVTDSKQTYCLIRHSDI